MNPGGLPENSKKVNERGSMQRFKTERGNPLCSVFGKKPRTNGFHEICSISSQIDRSQLTAVYWRGIVCVKTTPQKTRSRSVNNYKELQEIHVQVKSQYMDTNAQNNKHNNMFNVDANLKHVNAHE